MKGWRDTKWQHNMRLSLDYNFTMAGFVGKDGVTGEELESLVPKAKDIHKELAEKRRNGTLPFFDLPYQDTVEIKDMADDIADEFDNFVLLGIGGSALGPIALHNSLRHAHHNAQTKKERRGRPRMFFVDNVDPDQFTQLVESLDLAKTVFCVVTKSGGTSETMAQLMIARGLIQKHLGKKAVKKHIICITDPEKGNLRKIVDAEKLRCLIVPPKVGGRFSVFTPVGLFPAAVSGIDIDELLAGAADMDKRTAKESLRENPAYLFAALQYLLDTRHGKKMSVMMPYSQKLKDIADWYRQIWAESIGKKLDLKGKVVHTGQTPIKALGATDQHSQVQLYIEGPNDKSFTFLRVDKFDSEATIPKMYEDIEGIAFLGGQSLATLINAEQYATEVALMGAGRPCATVGFPAVNAFTVGQMLYMLEVQTAFAGGLYGINPFDQPGVEEGKLLTFAMMGRPGYEKKRRELEKVKKDKKYII
jgi:glucose-6-phosphate isomerase